MVVVGVVLLVLALLAAIGVFAGGTAFFTLAVGSITWATNSAQVFLTGAAVMLVLLAGAQVTWIGWKRQHRQHKDVRSLRRSAEAAGISGAPPDGDGQQQRMAEPTSAPAFDVGPEAVTPDTGQPEGRVQETARRRDPGDEIRTRPLDRQHRGDTER